MIKVKDLVPKQGNVDIELEIVELGIVREFSKFGKTGRVLTAVAQDGTGKVNLTLWNEQIELVNTGDKIVMKNCYVNEWQGEKQLSTGKMGTIEVMKAVKEAAKAEKKKGK